MLLVYDVAVTFDVDVLLLCKMNPLHVHFGRAVTNFLRAILPANARQSVFFLYFEFVFFVSQVCFARKCGAASSLEQERFLIATHQLRFRAAVPH